MKNLLLSSVVLLIFAFANIIFMFSCQKTLNGNDLEIQANETIVFMKTSKLCCDDAPEIWRIDVDGSNEKRINVNLGNLKLYFEPNILSRNGVPLLVSSSGKKLFLILESSDFPDKNYLYSCDIDGTNLIKISESDNGKRIYLGDNLK